MTCAHTLKALCSNQPRWLGKKWVMFWMSAICFCLSKRGSDNTFDKFPNCLTSQVHFSMLRLTQQRQLAFPPTSWVSGMLLHCCLWGWFSSASPICSLHKKNWGVPRGSLWSPGFKPQAEIVGFLTMSTPMRATWQSDCTHGLHPQRHLLPAQCC